MTDILPNDSALTVVCEPDQDEDDGLFHLYDVDPNVALCGRDLTDVPDRPMQPDEAPCIVCYELDKVLP
jgi:hypothetical protein